MTVPRPQRTTDNPSEINMYVHICNECVITDVNLRIQVIESIPLLSRREKELMNRLFALVMVCSMVFNWLYKSMVNTILWESRNITTYTSSLINVTYAESRYTIIKIVVCETFYVLSYRTWMGFKIEKEKRSVAFNSVLLKSSMANQLYVKKKLPAAQLWDLIIIAGRLYL